MMMKLLVGVCMHGWIPKNFYWKDYYVKYKFSMKRQCEKKNYKIYNDCRGYLKTFALFARGCLLFYIWGIDRNLEYCEEKKKSTFKV